MAGTFRGCTAGMVMAAALLGTVPPAAAGPAEPQTIALEVVNQAEVPQKVLLRAEAEATRIYRSLGINLVWTNTIKSGADLRLFVNIVSKPFGGKSVDGQAMGLTPGTKERRGIQAWAFYERILDFATTLGLDPGLLLGHVIAHEIGHLLLPYDSHSETGLMRGGWDKFQAMRAVTGALTFTADESALIRSRLARHTSNSVSSSPTRGARELTDRVASDRPAVVQ